MDDRLGDLLEVTPTEIRYADSPAAECRSSEISRHVIVRNRTQQDRIDVLMGIQEPFGKLISVVYPSSVIAGEDLPPPFTRALLGLDPGERILLKVHRAQGSVVGGDGCLVFGARLAETESILQYLRLPIVISSSLKAMVTEKSEDTLPTRPVSTTTQESGYRAVGDYSDATVLAADGSSCLDHSLVDSGDSESGSEEDDEGPITISDPKTGRTLYLVEGVGYCTSSGTMLINSKVQPKMRVRQLQTTLQDQGMIQQISMDQLSDMKMALDATFWLRSIQMLKDPYADALGGMPPGNRDNGVAVKDGLFGIIAKELELFSHYKIKPIFVFDGIVPPLQHQMFQQSSQQQLDQAWTLSANGRDSEAQKAFAVATSRINSDICHFAFHFLKSKGFEVIRAPYFASAQLAYMAANNLCQVVYGPPGLLLYG
ncbi:hypothetical protein FOZ63_016057, partial [Perkinsus olseni]